MPERYRLPALYQHDQDGVIVIAHRGASAYYPENTMAAFRGAAELGAEMIELDVLLSSDGIPVVFHDIKLDDHSSGQGLLSSCTLRQLRALDAGSWFDKRFAGVQIPTLEEVLDFAAGKIALNIELKTEAVTDQLSGGVEEKCLQLVKKYGMSKYILFSSFDYRAVVHLKSLDPNVSVALLYNQSTSKNRLPSELIGHYKADAFNVSYRQFNTERRTDLQKRGIPHFIYTVDRPNRMWKLLDAGVTGIFTNKPDLLKAIVNQWKREQ